MKKSFLVITLLVNLMSFDVLPIETKLQTSFPLFSWLLAKLTYKTDVPGGYYAVGAVAAVVAKVGYDISWHGDYEANANTSYNQLVNYINKNNISSLHDASLVNFFNSSDLDFCLKYEMWLQNSYNNWLTPWNWTSSQALAHKKMKILSMIMLHLPLVNLNSQEMEKEIDAHARKHCSVVSEYPLVYYGNLIDSHLAVLAKGLMADHLLVNNILLDLNQELKRIKYVLRGSQAYINECHAKKTHELLQQAANRR